MGKLNKTWSKYLYDKVDERVKALKGPFNVKFTISTVPEGTIISFQPEKGTPVTGVVDDEGEVTVTLLNRKYTISIEGYVVEPNNITIVKGIIDETEITATEVPTNIEFTVTGAPENTEITFQAEDEEPIVGVVGGEGALTVALFNKSYTLTIDNAYSINPENIIVSEGVADVTEIVVTENVGE